MVYCSKMYRGRVVGVVALQGGSKSVKGDVVRGEDIVFDDVIATAAGDGENRENSQLRLPWGCICKS